MNNNIVSFNAVVSAAKPKINTTTASSNIINISLTNANLKKQKDNNGTTYTGEDDINFNELKEYTLEELLAEGKETQAEVINTRNQKAADEVKNLIDSIGEVTLDSGEDIKSAAEAYNNLTAEQKALLDSADLQKLIAADKELVKLKEAELKRQQEEAERKRKEQLAKLEQLYKDRDDNNGLFHPKKEAEIEDKIRKLEAELGVPHKPDGWESFCNTVEDVAATAVTFTASVVEGIVDVAETIVDGTVQIVGGAASYVVSAIDEEAGAAMQKGIQDFVSYDASGSMYDAFVEASGIDPEIAYGWAHTAGNIAGQVVGYAAISMVPGGAALTAVAGGMAAAGAAAENAYANGATFNEAMLVSTAAGVMGAAGGAVTGKIGAAAKGAASLKGVVGYTAAGALTGSAEPLLNSAVEYATYGNNDGKSYLEFMNESGGWLNVAIGAGAGGVSTGTQALIGAKSNSVKNVELKQDSIELKPSALSQTNTVSNYNFDRDGYINYAFNLLEQGYDDNQIISMLADQGNMCSEIQNKLAFSDFTYEYLISRGYDPKDAATMIQNTYENLINSRGMTTVYVDKNGIRYNMINGFNQSNQAFDMNYITREVDKLPQQVKQNITEINIYDTFNPADYYWNNEYNSTGGYFRSAATGGNGTINFWSNSTVDSSIIPHEAGHCFDLNRQFSESQDYLRAIYDDKIYSGLDSVTEYGKNNSCEDFAESLAAYLGEKNGVNIDDFPNRKAYFDRILNSPSSVLTTESVNNLNKVTSILSNKYGPEKVTSIFYEYLTTGNINTITRTDGARDIISKMDMNEVLQYYNIINGG